MCAPGKTKGAVHATMTREEVTQWMLMCRAGFLSAEDSYSFGTQCSAHPTWLTSARRAAWTGTRRKGRSDQHGPCFGCRRCGPFGPSPRFQLFVQRLGLLAYWEQYGPPTPRNSGRGRYFSIDVEVRFRRPLCGRRRCALKWSLLGRRGTDGSFVSCRPSRDVRRAPKETSKLTAADILAATSPTIGAITD